MDERTLLRLEEKAEREIYEDEHVDHDIDHGLENYHNLITFVNPCHGCQKGGVFNEFPDCGHYTPACKETADKNRLEYIQWWEGENE